MNMNKALQNLYHAVSNQTTTKVNISKLLVDIHYAITGKESPVKNNWSRIIDSMATNWPEGGGGGSSDFSTASVTLICNATNEVTCGLAIVTEARPPFVPQDTTESLLTLYDGDEFTYTAVLYKGRCRFTALNATALSGTGNVQDITQSDAIITGDCTITIS